MEGGLVASFEKFVLDVDLLQMAIEFLKPLDTGEDALGVEAIREVGPGGHFFGAAHTLERYADAFYAPLISDWRNFQQWTGRRLAGSLADAPTPCGSRRSPNTRSRRMDPAIAEELDAFVGTAHRGGRAADGLLSEYVAKATGGHVAGPNGAGKTSAAPDLLRDAIGIDAFVNADRLTCHLPRRRGGYTTLVPLATSADRGRSRSGPAHGAKRGGHGERFASELRSFNQPSPGAGHCRQHSKWPSHRPSHLCCSP